VLPLPVCRRACWLLSPCACSLVLISAASHRSTWGWAGVWA